MPTYFAGTAETRAAGLLEQATLRLSGPDASGRRTLADADGRSVGFVDLARRWWGRTLWVHEAFEEPVVFRLRRRWTPWPRWRVFDADGEEVGTVGGAWLCDRWGRPAFRRQGQRFDFPAGGPAAEWDGERLALGPAVRDDPFWKMLLLAAVLAG